MSETFKLQLGLNKCTNAQYHADSKWLSSSSLKLVLEDPSKFYREKVLCEVPPQLPSNALDEGSLTHSLILEPDTVESEYAFFEGFRKAGPEFENFKALHPGKTIISAPQKSRCLAYKRAFEDNKTAQAILSGGEAEFSICQIIDDVHLKVRADYINVDKGYIADIKTSSFPCTKDHFALTIQQYKYELSAALYCMVAAQYYGKPFDFYFVAISKKDLDCHVFKTSERTRRLGVDQVTEALRIYKRCVETGVWQKEEIQQVEDSDKNEILEI